VTVEAQSRHPASQPRHPHHPPRGGPGCTPHSCGGWTAREIHQPSSAPSTSPAETYASPASLHLRETQGHDSWRATGTRYAYLLTPRGFRSACSSVLPQRLGRTARQHRFHHRPDPHHRPYSRLEAAYHPRPSHRKSVESPVPSLTSLPSLSSKDRRPQAQDPHQTFHFSPKNRRILVGFSNLFVDPNRDFTDHNIVWTHLSQLWVIRI